MANTRVKKTDLNVNKISASEALVIEAKPAQAEKNFPDLWVNRIVIVWPNPDKGIAQISTNYCNAKTGEILEQTDEESENQTLHIKDLPQAVEDVPEAASAIQALLTAIPALRTWQEEQEVNV